MSMRFLYWPAMICLVFMATSCLNNEEDAGGQLVKEQDEKIVAYLNQNNIKTTKTSSGVYYEMLKQNSNGVAVKDSNIVYIHYVLRDLEGNLIDSLSASADALQTARFLQEPNSVVPQGFYIGADLMNVGEKLRLFMPSYRAYQNFSYKTLISPDEIIMAELEVVKTESLEMQKTQEDQAIEQYIAIHQLDSVQHLPSGIYYQRLTSGSGDQAKSGDAVKLNYKGIYLNDTVFDQSTADKLLEFVVDRNTLIKGVNEGVKQMRKGEKARILIPSSLAYGPSIAIFPATIKDEFSKIAFTRPPFPPFTPVFFELELLDVK